MTKEEAKEAIKEAYGTSEYTDEIIKALSAEPRKMGEWIVNERLGGRIQCSECGAFSGLTEDDLKEGYPTANYCFKCGAKMNGGGYS